MPQMAAWGRQSAGNAGKPLAGQGDCCCQHPGTLPGLAETTQRVTALGELLALPPEARQAGWAGQRCCRSRGWIAGSPVHSGPTAEWPAPRPGAGGTGRRMHAGQWGPACA